MNNTKRLIVGCLFVLGVIFSCLNFFMIDNEYIKNFLITSLSIVIESVCLYWIFSTYRSTSYKIRYFWLFLSIGVSMMTFASVFVLLSYLFSSLLLYMEVLFVLWIIADTSLLIALIYITKLISKLISQSRIYFNIFIFLVFITSVVVYFLTAPVMEFTGNSIVGAVLLLTFSIINLSILFSVIGLFHLSRFSNFRNIIYIVGFGFCFLFVSDVLFTFEHILRVYKFGDFFNLFELLAVAFLGIGALESRNLKKDFKVTGNYSEEYESLTPYICIVILLFFAAYKYNWHLNSLSIGIMISILMVIIRQVYLLKRNNKLALGYRYLANHDPLTALGNRACFNEDLVEVMNNHSKFSLFLFDLDRFKNVNDTLGHLVGDAVLKEVSNRLRSSLKKEHLIYRIGGDEFVVVLPDELEESSKQWADTILSELSRPIKAEGQEIVTGASIGISFYPEHGQTKEELLKNADVAMYLAKDSGKNNYKFFDSTLNEIVTRRMLIENEIRHAIERNELAIHYQPKVALQTGEIIGMEALLRWNNPKIGIISPVEFIPIIEETRQIIPIGRWVLMEACKQAVKWNDISSTPLSVSVNVSVIQFQDLEFLKMVKNVLTETSITPELLELEITETVMKNHEQSTYILEELKNLGVKTSIDDFGTGYSSLNILRSTQVSAIKIDKSFIDGITEANKQSLIKTIIDMGLNLNIQVVAEGIEHTHQAKLLNDFNCHFGQGYLYSKPLGVSDFEKLLRLK